MHFLDERRPVALQALDHREEPQRAGPVEGLRGNQRRQVVQVPVGRSLGQRQAAQMAIERELRVAHPRRRRHVARRATHDLAQAGDCDHCSLEALAKQVEVGCPVENRDTDDVGGEVRILLHAPHQALGVSHLRGVSDGHGPRLDGSLVLAQRRARVRRCRWCQEIPARRIARTAARPSTRPTTAPPTTSDAWWMRT